MFKILHFSDSHLSLKQKTLSGRIPDFADALSEVVRVAKENSVDLVVDTGDSFDSPNPGPYSVRAYRLFLEELEQNGIPFLGITGNHNNHAEAKIFDHGDWMSAVSNTVIRPQDPANPIMLTSRDGRHKISVIAADFMQKDLIPDFVSKIPYVVDALFMHQSCEGFMPVIGRPELQLSHIDGKARYVGVGDIHITKKQETQLGTVVGSAGSTELVKDGEPMQKYVILVTIPDDKDAPPNWQPIEIQTRRVISWPCISTDAQLESFREQILRILPSCVEKKPMLMCSYVRSFFKRMEAFRESMKDLGINLMSFDPSPEIESGESVSSDKVIGSISMIEILSEVVRDEEPKNLCITLWENPTRITEILESYKQKVIDRYRNENQQD